jgi:hypothetical protein
MTQMVLPNHHQFKHPIAHAGEILSELSANVQLNGATLKTQKAGVYHIGILKQDKQRLNVVLEIPTSTDNQYYTFHISQESNPHPHPIVSQQELGKGKQALSSNYKMIRHNDTSRFRLLDTKGPATFTYEEGWCLAICRPNIPEVSIIKAKLVFLSSTWRNSYFSACTNEYQVQSLVGKELAAKGVHFLYFEAYTYSPNTSIRPIGNDIRRLQLLRQDEILQYVEGIEQPSGTIIYSQPRLGWFLYINDFQTPPVKVNEPKKFPQDPYSLLPWLPQGMKLQIETNPKGEIKVSPDWRDYYDFKKGCPI